MKKLVLFLLFVAAAVAGGWLFLANKFEHIVNAEILPKLTQHPEIIYVDPEAVRINKFKFDVSLGNLELFPDNEQFSASFGDVSAHYNPLKDKISFCFCGDKTSFVIGENNYYSKNLKGNFDFGRSLLQGVLSDFNITFDFADTSLHDETLDKKMLDVAGGQMDLSYSKKDGFVNPAIKIDLKDLEASDELTNAIREFYLNLMYSFSMQRDSDLEMKERKASREFYSSLSDIQKRVTGDNKIQYSLAIDTNLSEELADKVASFIVNPGVHVIAELVDSDQFSLNFIEKTKTTILSSNISLGVNKSGSYVELKSSIDGKSSLNQQQQDEFATLLPPLYSTYVKNVYDISEIDESFYRQYVDILINTTNVNTDMNVGYDIANNELKHDFNLSSKIYNKNYGFKSIGNFVDNKYNGSVKFDRLGESITGISTLVSDVSDLLVNQSYNMNENQKLSFVAVSKLAQYIKDNGFDVIKIFHKGGADNLTPDGKFEADIFVNADPENFSVEINGTKGTEILSDPTLANFMNNLPQ